MAGARQEPSAQQHPEGVALAFADERIGGCADREQQRQQQGD
jgi:hypothetical protein